MSNIAKMPTEERHNRFHSAASSSSSEQTTAAAADEDHSAHHPYANNCHAPSVGQSVAQTTSETQIM